MTQLTPDLRIGSLAIALRHVTREYPNKLDHVLAGRQDAVGTARASSRCSTAASTGIRAFMRYWMLAHLYRRFPGHAACCSDPRPV